LHRGLETEATLSFARTFRPPESVFEQTAELLPVPRRRARSKSRSCSPSPTRLLSTPGRWGSPYASVVLHFFKRVQERVPMMFEPRVPQPGDPESGPESRTDAAANMSVDAPTNYVRSYDEGRPRK